MNMDQQHPFTPEEKEIMDLLIEAHNKFCKMQAIDIGRDWSDRFHALQDVLIVRAAIRDYPKYFNQKP